MNRLLFLSALILAACSNQPPSKSNTPLTGTNTDVTVMVDEDTAPVSQTISPSPRQEILPLAYHHTSRNGIVMSLVSFDDRQFQLQVADQKNGPGTHWRDAHSAADALQGVAAINGGFFTPEGKPLGLVITNGIQRGSRNSSSLGSGIYLSQSHKSSLVRREAYKKSRKVRHLLQTGPMLVEQKSPISGLSNANHRARSFIAWDGAHHWAIGYAESCTLHTLSQALAGRAPAGFAIATAVNLDGGRSSDLWAGPKVLNGPKTHRSFLNKPVRNFLVVVPK
jgi:uncharacterized protein YigE (DUF2233 family)